MRHLLSRRADTRRGTQQASYAGIAWVSLRRISRCAAETFVVAPVNLIWRLTMKSCLCALIMTFLSLPALPGHSQITMYHSDLSTKHPVTDADKLVGALRAGPKFVTSNGTILDWPATPGA